MKRSYIILPGLITLSLSVNSYAQKTDKIKSETKAEAGAKSDVREQAAQYVAVLNLTDTAKASRVTLVIAKHLIAVRDWHNNHPYTLTPEGINPITGKVFSTLERQLIVDSTIPHSVHDDLMAGLRKDLTEDQVDVILDKYTIGKVEFTMKGYKSIVTDMTPEEENVIMTNLKLAREQAVDYKQVKEMSVIFKIYKTKIEDYLNTHGRDWRKLYKTYVDKVLAQKAAAKKG
ncbi:MAG: DUF3826 domain-containing protein [Bacteroidetes bacterium]|nr:DUF3826 domain-containing protein [Bacteroidota bacterium]